MIWPTLRFSKVVLTSHRPGLRDGSSLADAGNAPVPGRRVGARQSRVVRAKPSASTGERCPGGRLDAGAAGAQVPEQETRSFPLADDDRPETAADVGIDCPQCLGGFLRA